MTEVETPKIPHVQLSVLMDIPVVLSVAAIEEAGYDPKVVSDSQLSTMLQEFGDLLPDAVDAFLSDIPSLDVEVRGEAELALPPPLSTIRPEPGGIYTLPVPSMLDRIDLQSGAPVAEAPVMALTVEQARGALWALKKAWSLPGMHRQQREALMILISEAEWLCCAVPALHFFRSGDHPDACMLCGLGPDGHDERKQS